MTRRRPAPPPAVRLGRGSARPARDTAEVSAWRLIATPQDVVYRYRVTPPRGYDYILGAVEALTGHTAAEFCADQDLIVKSVHPDDHERLVINQLNDPDEWKRPATVRWLHPDGRIVWAEHLRVPVYDEHGRAVAVEGIARDITERVEAQQKLHTSESQLRRLAASLQTAREEERAALARELHDELGQTLTAIKLELARTAELLRRGPSNLGTVDRLQSLVGLAEIGVTTIKRIATELRPPALDHLGLADALRWEAATFSARSGLRTHVAANADGGALAPRQQTALFRIFQEALTNVARHAHASAVRVRTAVVNGAFELRVRDNGRGITAHEVTDPAAIGLLGMRERAVQAGGTLDISGRPGRGTIVTVRVPLKTPSAARTRTPTEQSR